MIEYIISEEELREYEDDANDDTYGCYDTERGDKIRSRPLEDELKKEKERVLNDYCKWDNSHWTTQRIKEYKESLLGEP